MLFFVDSIFPEHVFMISFVSTQSNLQLDCNKNSQFSRESIPWDQPVLSNKDIIFFLKETTVQLVLVGFKLMPNQQSQDINLDMLTMTLHYFTLFPLPLNLEKRSLYMIQDCDLQHILYHPSFGGECESSVCSINFMTYCLCLILCLVQRVKYVFNGSITLGLLYFL